jgi:hypothetical protein
MKDLRVTVDGDTHAVDSVEEAAILSDEAGGEDDVVAIHVQHTGREWVATVEDPDLDYEARDDRKWGGYSSRTPSHPSRWVACRVSPTRQNKVVCK